MQQDLERQGCMARRLWPSIAAAVLLASPAMGNRVEGPAECTGGTSPRKGPSVEAASNKFADEQTVFPSVGGCCLLTTQDNNVGKRVRRAQMHARLL